MQEVYKFIDTLNLNNKCVVAAISGGPDSMFLLDLLIKLRNKLNIKIVVAHVHHNLRKESDEEAIKVEEYCKNNNLIFEMKKIEKYPNNKFSEEAARKIRYEFFDEIIKKYNSDILFTAHHGDDLIETILMRITRGSTLNGYAGFKAISSSRGYKIARPLIYLTKQEIVKYLDENNIWYAQDMSNKSDNYTRNRYRNYILPELKKENINVHQKFINFSKKILSADEYLKNEASKIYNDIIKNEEICVSEFNKLDYIIKIYILEKYLNYIYKDNICAIGNTHIDIILDILSNKNNSIIDLPNNKKGVLEYNKFKIIDKLNDISYNIPFTDQVDLPNNYEIKVDNFTKISTNYVIHLNSKEIKLPFYVRNKKENDKMKVKNMNGTKKVNDIFTDCKVLKELRNTYPIVTDATGEIIWIPGLKKSHLDRKKEGKYDIILKYSQKEENNAKKTS